MSVEFLPDDVAPPADEAAPPRRHNGWRWPLLAVAALALGTAWATTRPAPVRPIAAPTPSPVTHAREVTPCHGVPDCAVRAGIPKALDAVVRQYLPATSAIHVHSYLATNSLTGGSQLVQRDIDAMAGSVNVLISVRRAGSAEHEIVDAPLGVGSLIVRRESSGYAVLLQYLAPETVPPTLSQLRMLARDPRLESL
ncbi:MAG TPA: hypothetical protein VFE19_08265 [Jatrophihabitantaceae bacterium]|nr:hypothetical protein [Jatrophihabitantaceae bacterium]